MNPPPTKHRPHALTRSIDTDPQYGVGSERLHVLYGRCLRSIDRAAGADRLRENLFEHR